MALRSALESGGVEFIDVGYAEEADIGTAGITAGIYKYTA
jgi:hypothetical protein